MKFKIEEEKEKQQKLKQQMDLLSVSVFSPGIRKHYN